VLAIVGATATGKTAVAEAVAESLRGEIVCADSRQLYRELEAGTGKPTRDERGARPHHLFDALELGERSTAGGYAAMASSVCRDVIARGRLPILVGGSGLYLAALADGLSEEPPHDPELRARLEAEAARLGVPALHARLQSVDPDSARRLHPGDRQRVTRALEVYEASGHTLTWWHRARPTRGLEATWTTVELAVPARALDERIATRTRAMFDGGLIEETAALAQAGRGSELAQLRAVGYDEALELLDGRIDRAEAEHRTNLRTRRLAKRQRTWFRRRPHAARLDAHEAPAGALARVVCATYDAGERGG